MTMVPESGDHLSLYRGAVRRTQGVVHRCGGAHLAATRHARQLNWSLQYAARNLLRAAGYEVVIASRTSANLLALHLARLFAKLEIDCVLDVGAHVGEYGTWLRHNGFRGRIVSFEPVAASFALLERRCGRDPRWDAHRTALGSSDTDAWINVTRSSNFSSFLAPNMYSQREFGDGALVVQGEVVPVRRLDGLFDEVTAGSRHGHVYLKMDTQGWDLQVLEGATGCLDGVAALQSEVSVNAIYHGMPTLLDSIARLGSLGYLLSGLFPVQLDSRLSVVEFDCVAVRDPSPTAGGSQLSRSAGSILEALCQERMGVSTS
jgi:FkbM family methyltransferase